MPFNLEQIKLEEGHKYLPAIVKFMKKDGFDNVFKNKIKTIDDIRKTNATAEYTLTIVDQDPQIVAGREHYGVFFYILTEDYDIGRGISNYIYRLFSDKYNFYLDEDNKDFKVTLSDIQDKLPKHDLFDDKYFIFSYYVVFKMELN